MSNPTPTYYRGGAPMQPHHQQQQQQQQQVPYNMAPQTPSRQPSTPMHPGTRRGPGPMVAQHGGPPQMSQIQIQHQQAAQRAMEAEARNRRSRKPTDKTITEAVEKIAPMVGLYNDMRKVEKRLDAAIMRKRLDIQDSVKSVPKHYKTLRVWVSNTAVNQPWQGTSGLDENAFDFDTGLIPSYRMKIEGRFLDDEDEKEGDSEDEEGMDVDEAAKVEKPKAPKPVCKFSKFIKSLSVDIERPSFDITDTNNNVEWVKYPQPVPGQKAPAPQPDFDAIEFERKLDLNTNCTIKIVRDEQPERYQLSPVLAELLDTTEDTKAGIVMGIWEYVMAHNLQEKDEKRIIVCDEKMKKVFRLDRIFFPDIPNLVAPHCLPSPPIILRYKIVIDTPDTEPTIFDIKVPVDDPIRARMFAIIQNPALSATQRSLAMEEDSIAETVQKINYSKAKRDFWTGLAEDPAGFIRRWGDSQKRDMEVILGDKSVDKEESRRAGFYASKVLEENAFMMLHGRDVPNGMRG